MGKCNVFNIRELLNDISGGLFIEGKDVVVVEGWVNNTVSLCAHIEILPDKEPIVCSGWQQIIASDGISYIGAGPLRLSKNALKSFISEPGQVSNIEPPAKG